MTFKKILGLSLVFMFALSTMTMTSCSKKEGCTDTMSDNYDSEAEEDDGSCVAWADKFEGEYNIVLGCAALTPLNAPFTMTASKTSANTLSLILETAALGTVPLSATINDGGKSFTINQLEVPSISTDLGELTDVKINGSADYGDDTNLTGSLLIDVGGSLLGPITDNCSMDGTRI